MSGIPHIPTIVSQEQHIIFVMLDLDALGCKFRQEFEPSRIRKQFENGQSTYQVLVNIQLGQMAD